MNDSSNRIKTSFILAICADAAFDTFFIVYLVEQYLRNDILSSSPLILFSFLLVLVVAPFVLSIVALNYIKNAVPVDRKDRVFRIITKVLSIITIVGSSAIFLVSLLLGAVIGTIHIV